jgi:hypothetical protein
MGSVVGKTPEERLVSLLTCADRLGIERLVLHGGMKIGLGNPPPEQLSQDNDDCIRAIRYRPDRTLGFVYLNPNYLDFSLRELERCVRDGPMVGVKFLVARRANSPDHDPIVRRAGELKAAILQHTWINAKGNPPGESTPMDLAELAARHPKVTFICGHAGGDWERGIRVIRPVKNIMIEVAGSDPTAGFVEMAVRELGADRILYGSDAGGRSFASQFAKVLGADLPDEAKRLILGGNLRRLLGPILESKGIRT